MVTAMSAGSAQPDTVRIAALLKEGSDYVLRPGNEKKDLDSALFFLNKALALSRSIGSDKWINATLKWKGDCFLEGNDLAPGVSCFQQVIDYYHRNGDRWSEAATWARLGECIGNVNYAFTSEKVKCYNHAWQLYRALGDTLMALRALKDMADAHIYLPDLDLAERELLAAVDGYRAIHFRYLHYSYDLLRAVARLKGDLAKEVFYTIEMVRSLDSTDERDDLGLVEDLYSRAGVSFTDAGLHERGQFCAMKAWALAKKTGILVDYRIVRVIVTNLLYKDSATQALAFALEAVNHYPPGNKEEQTSIAWAMGSCYSTLGNFAMAEKQYRSMAEYLDSNRVFHLHQGTTEYNQELILAIGNYCLLTHQLGKAESYGKQLVTDPHQHIALEQRGRIERFLWRVDSSMGRYRQGLGHFETFQRLRDSLFGVQKTVQIEELQIKYATDEKDKDLRIQAGNIQLLTKQNQLQHEQVGKSRILRNMMIAGLLVLLLLVGLIYNRYRLKQQKNRQLEAKQKEITDQNRELERLLTENEWLLREVHHRVKNNLQVIMSLLKSQSDFLQDKAALDAVVESEHRVYAMSLIHQKLYKSSNVSSINMPEYIGDLVEYLRYSFAVSGKLWFDLQVEPIYLDLQQAVPVGLILNEVITNSVKYAFPCSDHDKITVRLFAKENGWITLIIADNGRGLPPNFDPKQRNSFGMLLIGGLTEDLEGSLHIESIQGTSVHICFRQINTGAVSEGGSGESAHF